MSAEHTEALPEFPLTDAALIGAVSELSNLLWIATVALEAEGFADEAESMRTQALAAPTYRDAVAVITAFVEPA